MSVEARGRADRRDADFVLHRTAEANIERAAREHAAGRKAPAGRGARARIVTRGKEGARRAVSHRVADEGDGRGDIGW